MCANPPREAASCYGMPHPTVSPVLSDINSYKHSDPRYCNFCHAFTHNQNKSPFYISIMNSRPMKSEPMPNIFWTKNQSFK